MENAANGQPLSVGSSNHGGTTKGNSQREDQGHAVLDGEGGGSGCTDHRLGGGVWLCPGGNAPQCHQRWREACPGGCNDGGTGGSDRRCTCDDHALIGWGLET
jgi:hypothetical protein